MSYGRCSCAVVAGVHWSDGCPGAESSLLDQFSSNGCPVARKLPAVGETWQVSVTWLPSDLRGNHGAGIRSGNRRDNDVRRDHVGNTTAGPPRRAWTSGRDKRTDPAASGRPRMARGLAVLRHRDL